MADIPTVPAETPDQSQLNIAQKGPPYSSLWWTSLNVDDIPESALGWHLAQGWVIDTVDYDDSTTPPTPSYTLTKTSTQAPSVLQSLLNSYTVAANDATWANQVRYNQVIVDWTELIASSQDQFVATTAVQNTHCALYLGNLSTYMDEVEALIGEGDPELDALLANIVPFLDLGDDRYDAFEAAFDTVLEKLPSDFLTFRPLARTFLTDLGTTELARINEKFAATLATQTQQLVDRGMSSSSLITDITARNTRDKNEEIASLNDRINREKLDNEHKLYGQQQSMRDRVLAGTALTYSLYLELLKLRIASMLQNAELKIKFRSTAVAELMNAKMARLNGLQQVRDDNLKLMAYQLDERNKLIIGLYGFVERRDDIAPEFSELAKLATSLGDSGGGWVAP